MSAFTRWPQELTDMIIDLDSRGWTAQAIADAANLKYHTHYTKNSIIGKLNRLANTRLRRGAQ